MSCLAETGVLGAVLAAGASRRFGGCKALAPYRHSTFVSATLQTLHLAGCAATAVVVAEPHAARIRQALPEECPCLLNESPGHGMAGSLQIAIAWARRQGAQALVIALVDHPRVSSGTVRVLIEQWRSHDAQVVRPVHQGRGGHPFVIDAGLFPRLLDQPSGADLRPLLRAKRLDLPVTDPGVLDDWDTPASVVRSALPAC